MSTVRQPSMKLVKCCTVGDGESVTPNTNFEATWLIQNSGETIWPPFTVFKEISGYLGLENVFVNVPQLTPMDSCKITISLKSPSQKGDFCTKWQLCTNDNTKFGGKKSYNSILEHFLSLLTLERRLFLYTPKTTRRSQLTSFGKKMKGYT